MEGAPPGPWLLAASGAARRRRVHVVLHCWLCTAGFTSCHVAVEGAMGPMPCLGHTQSVVPRCLQRRCRCGLPKAKSVPPPPARTPLLKSHALHAAQGVRADQAGAARRARRGLGNRLLTGGRRAEGPGRQLPGSLRHPSRIRQAGHRCRQPPTP